METKTSIDSVSLIIKDNILILEREKGFYSMDTFKSGVGIGDVRSIITYSMKSPTAASNSIQYEKILKSLNQTVEFQKPAATAIGNYDIINGVNKTLKGVTAVVCPGNSIHKPLNITVLIDRDLDEKALIDIFQTIIETRTDIFQYFGVKNYSKYSKDDDYSPVSPDNNYSPVPDDDYSTINGFNQEHFMHKDEIMVACKGRGEGKSKKEMYEICLMVIKCVHEALRDLLSNFGYPLGIVEHIESVGVTIDDLVEAGMQLCVGVERTVELDNKLNKQLFKSLEDLNVAALIIAGIRLEEDLQRQRIRGIDVSDDPAYLYSDEVFGMAVANQIAGTKAIFNFKRYDEEKPGIIGSLGPVLDDIFAGLVAGCMSKMFEE